MVLGKRKPIVGVIGASEPSAALRKAAHEAGKLIAGKGWILLNGGLGGVMEASARGASEERGMVVGIIPGPAKEEANPYVSIPIVTNMGHARNIIIAHTADVLLAVGGGEGTLSEIAISLKLGKLVVGIDTWDIPGVLKAESPQKGIDAMDRHLTSR